MAGWRTTFHDLLRRWRLARETRREENDAWRKKRAADELKRAKDGGFSGTGGGGAF